MKEQKKHLIIGISGGLILTGVLILTGGLTWGLRHPFQASPAPVFTFEYTPDTATSDPVGKRMSVKQVECLEYSIVPMEDLIVSEPSPDWGILICFGKDRSNYLYFYESRSPGGIEPFPREQENPNCTEINGKDVTWGISGGRVTGSYRFSGSCGIIFSLEEPLWEENRDLVFELIESAQIETDFS